MKTLAKLLYWKLCFPKFIKLLPPRLSIVSGPFRGMRYTIRACGSAHSAKLLGTYEKELHPVIAQIERANFEKVIDIGAAEGYYAVGLARMNPSCQIVGFEATEYGRSLMSQVAAWNGAKNLEILDTCDLKSLHKESSGAQKKLIICDVEGFELELLDPERVPGLRQCFILVELHDAPAQPISAVIRQRFEGSHTIAELLPSCRIWKDFPQPNLFAKILPRAAALRAMNEFRGAQSWFWMAPHNS